MNNIEEIQSFIDKMGHGLNDLLKGYYGYIKMNFANGKYVKGEFHLTVKPENDRVKA